MIIHGLSNANYNIDLGLVFVTDWYRKDYFSIVEEVVGNGTDSNPRSSSDNNLINGKMDFGCSTVAADLYISSTHTLTTPETIHHKCRNSRHGLLVRNGENICAPKVAQRELLYDDQSMLQTFKVYCDRR